MLGYNNHDVGVWSRYNTYFKGDYGFFLYNALYNILVEMDEKHFMMIEDYLSDGVIRLGSVEDDFYMFLRDNKFIVSRWEEDDLIMLERYKRTEMCFDSSVLGLIICPTLSCNFNCSYCFEGRQKKYGLMSHEVVDNIINFFKSQKNYDNFSVTWFGGEPTLAFNVIELLTKKFIAMYPNYSNAGLMTNGYLLDKDKVDKLNELRIGEIQITIDGPDESHDKIRKNKDGKPTYNKIIQNIDYLVESSYGGKCSIRVNLDKKNKNEYVDLYLNLKNRYKDSCIRIYPDAIRYVSDNNHDKACVLSKFEWTDFLINAYNNSEMIGGIDFYPKSNVCNICTANSCNRYVIGPEGEIYKCWEDVGKKNMIVGSVNNDNPITNLNLIAQYSIGTDPFDDKECTQCSVLPICGGGCVNKRLRSRLYNEDSLNFCSPFKGNLIKYLEAYISVYRVNEVCDALLLGGKGRIGDNVGWRMIHPRAVISGQHPFL